ncbi:hypothetical protein [Paraburkholderia sp. BL10I2N1]|uniref:hypothetical protein n=1 Tax=Paraburkholderia sp. BL10I2N1 TaxID=1938796 RepID=UPI00105FB3F9|nr:hypothetical protein [Paraburkholderia sp. BL10I2N1]TDN69087.1 hypothetical protein B0G77_2456 [Paraburkholderia sp. BL10I2N1]
MALDMDIFNVRVDKGDAARFRAMLDERGISITQFLRGAVDTFVKTGEMRYPIGEDFTAKRRLGIPNKPKAAA